jgi:hypothetical protein
MHPDVHLVRTRPPILDVPPLVWIDPPAPLWGPRAGDDSPSALFFQQFICR